MAPFINLNKYSSLGITSGTVPASPVQMSNQYHIYAQQSIGGTPPSLISSSHALRVPDLSAGMIQMGDDFNAPLSGELGFGEE
jgi:hypothetical protein